MTNRLRTEIPEEEQETELIVEEKKAPSAEIPDNFLTQFLTNGFMSAERAMKELPFVLYLAFLGMIYIGNRYLAEKNASEINKLTKDVKELSYAYKVTKADLAFKATLSEVALRADTLGLKESLQPAQRITVKEGEDGDKN